MSDLGAAYRDARTRLTELLRGADPASIEHRVPASPAWTVKDAVAHVTGILDDVSNGRLEGVGSDAWTGAQVAARHDRTLVEVLGEWEERGTALEAGLADGSVPEFVGALLLADLACHEGDIRGALGVHAVPDAASTRVALDGHLGQLGDRISGASLPPLRVVAGDVDRTVGGDEPGATVTTSVWELFRAVTGRRTHDQIRGFDWEGDPSPYLAVFSSYGTPDEPLHERP